LPELHPDAKEGDSDKIELDLGVVQLVKDYVLALASMYRRNPFHNFEVSVIGVDNYNQATTFDEHILTFVSETDSMLPM
jgi:hypothetical protein